MKRTVTATLLALTLALSAYAGGRAEEGVGAQQEATAVEPVTIRVFGEIDIPDDSGLALLRDRASVSFQAANQYRYANTAKTLIDEFEATHPNIRIDYTFVGWGDLQRKTLSAMLAGGSQVPDVSVGEWAGNFAARGLLLPLDDMDYPIDDIMPGLAEWNTVDGVLYAIPKYTMVMMLAYNVEWFEREGIAEPETMQEYMAAARKLTDAEQGVYGVGLRSGGNQTMRTAPYFWTWGVEYVNEERTRATFNTESAVEALTFLQDLTQYAHPGVLSGAVQDRQAFAEQKVAMILDGTALPNFMDNQPEENRFRYKLISFPAGPTGNRYNTLAGAPAMFVPKAAGNPDAAKEYIKFITSEDSQKAFYLGTNGVRVPALRSALSSALIQTSPFAYAWEDGLGNGRALPSFANDTKVWDRFTEAVRKTLLGETEPTQALAVAEREANEILATQE